MKPRGVKHIFEDQRGRFIALCKDGTMWITLHMDATGTANWTQIKSIPKRD
jgi:hypothetical protein